MSLGHTEEVEEANKRSIDRSRWKLRSGRVPYLRKGCRVDRRRKIVSEPSVRFVSDMALHHIRRLTRELCTCLGVSSPSLINGLPCTPVKSPPTLCKNSTLTKNQPSSFCAPRRQTDVSNKFGTTKWTRPPAIPHNSVQYVCQPTVDVLPIL